MARTLAWLAGTRRGGFREKSVWAGIDALVEGEPFGHEAVEAGGWVAKPAFCGCAPRAALDVEVEDPLGVACGPAAVICVELGDGGVGTVNALIGRRVLNFDLDALVGAARLHHLVGAEEHIVVRGVSAGHCDHLVVRRDADGLCCMRGRGVFRGFEPVAFKGVAYSEEEQAFV